MKEMSKFDEAIYILIVDLISKKERFGSKNVNLGDYRNYPLSEAACRVLADFWRPRDRELGGATAIYGHLEVSQQGTECPARIMEQRNHIVDLVNTDPTPRS